MDDSGILLTLYILGNINTTGLTFITFNLIRTTFRTARIFTAIFFYSIGISGVRDFISHWL
ncbi:MAG: DUF378 domain-containing protein [gamma proteobacterium symbiont of Bathyaustriella thionipta]|nr:DUF378 domain-containing protein [gamma proteobacterium symbiont of Bathyaustriella thionipta]MCU7949592.1 DUF378 domain-containing protein [gamma proteobacterium symbiont of Bathyaustriella thionipta]MCU7953261.1 DUF378 domain-containing protein [gamma proteobacterium symbiont of Bathyaustriella thionipta]MCU7956184.1 DUF378 domain-containing protein [gamma proteobacterium symbiont of Bathyaustriella thionipta]MCU7968847.1 DUF378 domain-containing protein [gamma proteobacterium symbiont of 